MIGPRVGDQAPDFSLVGTEGTFRLSEQRGRRVLLLFYPGDNTPVCTRQFCSYRDDSEIMESLDAVVVGVSAQSEDSHIAFAARYGLTTPLLADTDGAVAKLVGVWRPVIGTKRAVVAIDEEGIIRHRHVHTLGLDYQDASELQDALAF